MTTEKLPETNENGFVTVSDFYSHHHPSIETGLKNAQFPHEIKFYVSDESYLQGAFRVYVPQEYLEAAKDLCISIEISRLKTDK